MRMLVTGASGFIGGQFAARALEAGHEVRCTGRRTEPMQWLAGRGALCSAGDLADAAFARTVAHGCEVIVHCAGAVGTWGSYEHFHLANVTVTEHMLDSARHHGVRRFVHLSSPSIYFDGQHHRQISEEFVPRRFFDHYGATKYLADQALLLAGRNGLEVIALRPRFVIGAGDTSIFPRLLRAHAAGRLRIVGNGTNRVDLTPVDNLVDAMLLALSAPASALGRAYNISNGAPEAFWPTFNALLARLDLAPLTRHVPYRLAYALAGLAEWRARRMPGQPEPAVSRLGMAVMARDFSLDIAAAREQLGYVPRLTAQEGVEQFARWWQAGMPSPE